MKKNYILDTNILLLDYTAIERFLDGNNIFIPLIVIEELEDKKSNSGLLGYNARQSLKYIYENMDKINIVSQKEAFALDVVNMSMNDIVILQNVSYLIKLYSKNIQSLDWVFTLVTNDIALRIKAETIFKKAYGFTTEEFKDEKKIELGELRTGLHEVTFGEEEIIRRFYNDKQIELSEVFRGSDSHGKFQNEFVIMYDSNNEKHTGVGIIKGKKIIPLRYNNITPSGLKLRNLEQKCMIELLFDENIIATSFTGKAGTAKTLLTLCSGLEQIRKGRYKKMYIAKPPIPIAKELYTGFKKGDENAKYMRTLGSITTNLEVVSKNNSGKEDLISKIENNIIEILPLEDILGMSLNSSFVLIDEAQLLSADIFKAILTRIGEGSKMIFTGDLEQTTGVDLLSEETGLYRFVNRFKDCDLAGHFTPKKIHRSEFVERVYKLWG